MGEDAETSESDSDDGRNLVSEDEWLTGTGTSREEDLIVRKVLGAVRTTKAGNTGKKTQKPQVDHRHLRQERRYLSEAFLLKPSGSSLDYCKLFRHYACTSEKQSRNRRDRRLIVVTVTDSHEYARFVGLPSVPLFRP